MSRIEELLRDVEGNALMHQLLDQVEQDRAAARRKRDASDRSGSGRDRDVHVAETLGESIDVR